MKQALRFCLWFVAIVFGVAFAIIATLYFSMRASLPQLDGEIRDAGFIAPVTATRDVQGTVTIFAKEPRDAMRALGFIHAQERFFEMDLARRSAAGELSALLGEATIKLDKDKRQHRLRARMAAQWQQFSKADREWISVYTQGVNAGLNALAVRPWQYLVLRSAPQPWQEIDSMLVIAEMYAMLQSRGIEERFNEALLRREIGDTLFDWFRPAGGHWDAALDGSVVTPPPLPPPSVLNVRKGIAATQNAADSHQDPARADDVATGSNNWAVGGALSSHGGAIVADDMHLALGVPNIWFRAQFHIGKELLPHASSVQPCRAGRRWSWAATAISPGGSQMATANGLTGSRSSRERRWRPRSKPSAKPSS